MSQVPSSSPSRAQRVPGAINAVLAIVVLVLVAILSLRASHSSPPPIAEFAPQVQKTIQQAPQEQTTVFGNGAGGGGLGATAGATPTPAPTPQPSPTPLPEGTKFNPCVGDPPRQIEDPQSPPCIPSWTDPKGNGGATSPGVSGSEIVVEADTAPTTPMLDFFNKRFELYNRKVIIKGAPAGDANNTGPNNSSQASQRALANDEVATNHPFAAEEIQNGSGISYADELAHNKVISIMTRPFFSESYLSSRAPYIWSYPMAMDTLQRTFAAWACARLAGGVAVHAGPGSQGQPRQYGLVFSTESQDIPSDTQVFKDSVASCGIKIAYEAMPTTGSDSVAQAKQNMETAVLQFKAKGVTSVFFLGDRTNLGDLQKDAEAQSYQPEWLITNYDLIDDANMIVVVNSPNDQRAHTFGITDVPMERQHQDHPSTWADPVTPYTLGDEGSDEVYHDTLLIFAGIQMAGPNLTPSSFQSGLQGTTFPNPNHPIMAGKVGFNGGSHAMTIDAAEWYWSVTDPGPYPDEKNTGTFCYVAHGARHSLANPWPAGDPFMQGPCDSGNEPA
jgi:hypothetical protein